MNDEEFLRLTTLYLEDAIDDGDLELLNRELANSPDRVRQFNDFRLITGLINEHGRTVETRDAAGGSFKTRSGSRLDFRHSAKTETLDEFRYHRQCVETGSDRATNSHAKSETPSASHFRPRRAAAIALAVLATVASLLLVVNWSGWSGITQQRGYVAPAIARLAYTSHARWGSEERVLGDRLGKGKLHLEVGLARLDFRNGATVTLQGPAEFEILSTDKTILSSGILTACIPESAVGFEVVTPAMDVVDLGTAFGVSVGADGETDVCVFEGEVEVSRSVSEAASNFQRRPQLVREGNAVRSKPKADSIDLVDYSTERYEDAWPVTSGVLQATGLMKFVSPGPEFVPGRYEDSGRILVFLERSHVLLKSNLKVNATEPGQYMRVRRKDKQPISAGQVIRSYLLQLNPIGEFGRKETDAARIIGQVTFDRPILGLIGGARLLSGTDEVLGHPLGDYRGSRRGIEPTRPDDQPDSGRDSVILSRDRRTLSLDLSASSEVDQIRVIVAEQ